MEISKKRNRNVVMKGSPYEGEGGKWGGGQETRATGGAGGRDTDTGEEAGIHSPPDKLYRELIELIG
jgi:hypothetical protein